MYRKQLRQAVELKQFPIKVSFKEAKPLYIYEDKIEKVEDNNNLITVEIEDMFFVGGILQFFPTNDHLGVRPFIVYDDITGIEENKNETVRLFQNETLETLDSLKMLQDGQKSIYSKIEAFVDEIFDYKEQ